MVKLIACLSTGKGTWGHVSRLIEEKDFDNIILVTNEYGKENFNANEKTEFVVVDINQGLKELIEEIKTNLKEKLKNETEVMVNFVSGTGKEHMALMSSLLNLGVGIRLTALTKEGAEDL